MLMSKADVFEHSYFRHLSPATKSMFDRLYKHDWLFFQMDVSNSSVINRKLIIWLKYWLNWRHFYQLICMGLLKCSLSRDLLSAVLQYLSFSINEVN